MTLAPLVGTVAVVSGASRGIGLATAEALRAAGASVIRLARSLVDEDGDGWVSRACDLAEGGAVERMADALLAEFGPPHCLISNAGSFHLGPLEETTLAEFDSQLGINLRAPFTLARAFLPAMRVAGRGRHILVGSVADHRAFPKNAAYAASKFGARGLHEVLREEYRGTGILCTLVSPGPTDTTLWDPIDPDSRPGFTPRPAMLRPADVADAILFVATRPAHVDVDWLRLGPA